VNTAQQFEKKKICLPEIIIPGTDSLQPPQQKKIQNRSTKNKINKQMKEKLGKSRELEEVTQILSNPPLISNYSSIKKKRKCTGCC